MGEPTAASMVFGYCGVAAAFCLFLSPVPTCRRICNERSILAFSILPYLAQFVESSWWALWALAAGDRFEMLLNNVIGASFMLSYVFVFAFFVQRERRVSTYGQIAVALLLVGCAMLVAVFVENPDTIFGVSAVTLNCIKYASPLSVTRQVIKTKSVEFMPLPLTLASLACGVFWGGHGVLLMDAYIWAPNLVGVLFATVQVLLYVWYGQCCGHKGAESTIEDGAKEANDKESIVVVGQVGPEQAPEVPQKRGVQTNLNGFGIFFPEKQEETETQNDDFYI